MIKEAYTNFDGDKYITDYTYDANGNMTKYVHTGPDGQLYSINAEYKLVYIPYNMTEQIKDIIYIYIEY